MSVMTILGAGYMGSALAVVAAERGHQVRLWGTWLDDELIGPVSRGEAHPRLKLVLPALVRPFHHGELAPALRGAELVVCAVNSDGVLPVLERALPHLPEQGPLLSVTKGFLADAAGRIQRISVVVRERLLRPAGKDRPWVAIAGPCKAMEVARQVPTAVVWAADERKTAERYAQLLDAPYYHISRSDDLAGAETCSAFKNAYATASGLCDGLQQVQQRELYNTKAMLFAQAIHEMTLMVTAMGGRASTVHGQAGVGDLHVTAAAGRNRAYGERVGLGEPPEQVAARMLAAGELTEGYPALRTGHELVGQLAQDGTLARADFPLLAALHAVVYGGQEVAASLSELRIREG